MCAELMHLLEISKRLVVVVVVVVVQKETGGEGVRGLREITFVSAVKTVAVQRRLKRLF